MPIKEEKTHVGKDFDVFRRLNEVRLTQRRVHKPLPEAEGTKPAPGSVATPEDKKEMSDVAKAYAFKFGR